MRGHFYRVRNFILPAIDFFYPLLKRWLPLQTFRYLVSGLSNTALGLAVFYVSYHYIFKTENFHFGFYAFESYTAALIISFTASFLYGFFLMKYVVFDDSKIRGSVQLFRYLLVCLFNFVLNWALLKLAVEIGHIYPTFAQMGTTFVVILSGYLAQRYFSFRKDKQLPNYIDEKDIIDSGIK